MSLNDDIQALQFGKRVDLYIIDFNGVIPFDPSPSGVIYFSPYRDGESNIVFNGQPYSYVGCEMSNVRSEAGGELPQPSVVIDKESLFAMPEFQNIVSQYKAATGNRFFYQWAGATFTRIRTRDVYLDNGATPDTTQVSRLDLIVDQNTTIDNTTIEISLTPSLGSDILNEDAIEELAVNRCSLRYRRWNGSSFEYLNYKAGGCPYQNPSSEMTFDASITDRYFGVNDASTPNANEDVCSKTVTGCQKRFDPNKTGLTLPIRAILKQNRDA